jgi:hypothetical protein
MKTLNGVIDIPNKITLNNEKCKWVSRKCIILMQSKDILTLDLPMH